MCLPSFHTAMRPVLANRNGWSERGEIPQDLRDQANAIFKSNDLLDAALARAKLNYSTQDAREMADGLYYKLGQNIQTDREQQDEVVAAIKDYAQHLLDLAKKPSVVEKVKATTKKILRTAKPSKSPA